MCVVWSLLKIFDRRSRAGLDRSGGCGHWCGQRLIGSALHLYELDKQLVNIIDTATWKERGLGEDFALFQENDKE